MNVILTGGILYNCFEITFAGTSFFIYRVAVVVISVGIATISVVVVVDAATTAFRENSGT